MSFKIKDYVKIKNQKDIYTIEEIKDDNVLLKALTCRCMIYEKLDNITQASSLEVDDIINKEKETIQKIKTISSLRNSSKLIYGTILHIDGDKEYLESCLSLYKELNIFANGIYIKEEDVKNKIESLILELTPDIVVITGHDIYNGRGIKDINNYKNTGHFKDALRIIRRHFNQENMTVIVGACASHFEALIAAGANFSSSPKRINIHTYDPAIIAIKVATTSINQNVDFEQTLKFIENKKDAFGGIETKGKMKILL